MIAVDVMVGLLGVVIVAGTLGGAIRTVVVPRAESVLTARVVFIGARWIFGKVAARRSGFEARDAVMARFAPMALMFLPIVWSIGVIVGFSALFWSLGVHPYREAFALSGSSLTTLGFRTTSDLPTLLLEILEGLIGLGLVALLISFLPTIYSHFSRRETAVAKLATRSSDVHGESRPAEMLIRVHRVGGLDQLTEVWSEWEDWFVELEESHTSFPMLAFFRSPVSNRSWITSAGLALDTAAIYISALDMPRTPRAPLMIRSGTSALRRIALFFDFEFDDDPAPDDRISVDREEFLDVFDELAGAGLPVRSDREQAWRDFAGWRVNYDAVLLPLCAWTMAPPALWSSDRSVAVQRPRIVRPSRHFMRWSRM